MQQFKITYRKQAIISLILGAINTLNGILVFYLPWTILKDKPSPSILRPVYELVYNNLSVFFVVNLLIFAIVVFLSIRIFRSTNKTLVVITSAIFGSTLAIIGIVGVVLQYFFIGMMASTL